MMNKTISYWDKLKGGMSSMSSEKTNSSPSKSPQLFSSDFKSL